MVKYEEAALDRVFAALADPMRRALLAQLGKQDGMSISDLARPFPVSLPAVMKHLDVLAAAGLVTRTKQGRTVACQLTAGPMEQAMSWLAFYQRFWADQLDRLAIFVEQETWKRTNATTPPKTKTKKPTLKKSKPATSPASPSRGISKRRRRLSTRPGPTRKN